MWVVTEMTGALVGFAEVKLGEKEKNAPLRNFFQRFQLKKECQSQSRLLVCPKVGGVRQNGKTTFKSVTKEQRKCTCVCVCVCVSEKGER